MKVLVIVSSGRKQGNTAEIAKLLIKQIEEQASKDTYYLETELIFLNDYEIKHCIGCRNCMDRGEDKCPLNDDLSKIKAKIDESDAVIFGSPVYVDNVNSMMKALIDRLAYICHRQEFYDKSAFVYSTSGGSSNKKTNNTMVGALISWGFNFIGRAGFTIKHHDTKKEIEERYNSSLIAISNKIYKSLIERSYTNPSVISLAIFKVQQKERGDPKKAHPLDYKYWKEKGWANPRTKYYGDITLSPFKMFLGNVIYRIISLLYVH